MAAALSLPSPVSRDPHGNFATPQLPNDFVPADSGHSQQGIVKATIFNSISAQPVASENFDMSWNVVFNTFVRSGSYSNVLAGTTSN